MADNQYTFRVKFNDFIVLYRGVEKVWIDNSDGIFYVQMVDGAIQTSLGPVTAYHWALEQGFEGTFEEWVQTVLEGTQHALDSEAYALGTRNSSAVSSSDPTYHNNSKYFSEQAASSSSSANNSKNAAQTAKTAAETARNEAKAAQTAAETAQAAAENAETSAEEYASSAQGAKTDAQTFATNASTSAQQAATKASEASASATAAADSETNAVLSETNANASALAAAASATSAETSATNASASASLAEGSATDAALAMTNAQAAQAAAETAQGKAESAIVHAPRININDTWEVWSQTTEQWVDTGHKSMAEATTEYSYQNSTSGTNVPSGYWTVTPNPQSGKYLWARIKYTWTNGRIDYFYNVAYVGVNGSGAVHSINGLVGNVILDGSNVYVDNNAEPKESIREALTRVGTVITNSEIDVLFNVD